MLRNPMKRICVFCGASPGRDPRYVEAARALGRELVERGLELVYGGGSVGLMGQVADAVLAAGGRVTGVIPEVLTWAQLGLHQRPVGLLDVAGYYAPLIAFFDQAEAAGFLRAEHRRLLLVGRQPGALLETLRAFRPDGPVERLIDRATS